MGVCWSTSGHVVGEHHKRNAPQAGGTLSVSRRRRTEQLTEAATSVDMKRRAVAAIRPGALGGAHGISGAAMLAHPYGHAHKFAFVLTLRLLVAL